MARPEGGYRTADGTKVEGVTSPIGRFMNPHVLKAWAYKCGKAGINIYERTQDAADAGTIGHDLVYKDMHQLPQPFSSLEDALNPVMETYKCSPEVAKSALGAYKHYLENFKEQWWPWDILASEQPLVSEWYHFGGTPDYVLKRNDRIYVADVKTGGAYADVIIQMGAYSQLIYEVLHLKVDKGLILRFPREKDGMPGVCIFKILEPEHLALGWEQFQLYLEAFHNDKQLTEMMK